MCQKLMVSSKIQRLLIKEIIEEAEAFFRDISRVCIKYYCKYCRYII
jgi:hypothetical protein